MGSLYAWLEKVFGASYRVTLAGYGLALYQLWELIDGAMKDGADWRHALYAAFFAWLGRILKEGRVTGGKVPATVEAKARTTETAATPVTPGGTVITGAAGMIAIAVLASALACVPIHRYDPRTADDIARITSKATAAAECPAALVHADDTTRPSYDPKSARHLHELCDCYARAANGAQESTCKATAKSYAVYEENKR